MHRIARLITALLLGLAANVLHAQSLSLLGLRSLNQHGAFHGLKHDPAGNLYTLFDAQDGVRLLKFSEDGATLLAQTQIGQEGDAGVALDVDANGFISIAGTSTSNGSIAGTAATAFPSRADATTNSFVARFTPTLTLQWLSFVGSGRTAVTGIAATTTAVYVTGGIYAPTLPVTSGGVQQFPAPGSAGNGFVESFNAADGTLRYATYLTGANGDTQPAGIAVDDSGSVYVAGTTSASGYPTVSALIPVLRYAGSYPVSGFVTRLTAAGDGLLFSTFVPGAGLSSIALDQCKALLLSGNISSGLFPLTAAQQPIASGLQYQSAIRMALDGSQVFSSTLLAPADQSVIAADSSSRSWVFASSTGTPPLPPLLPLEARGNAYAVRVGSDGKVDRVSRLGGAPISDSSSAAIPVSAGGVSVAKDGAVTVSGSVTPTLSSDLVANLFYDFPLVAAPNTALPADVRSATPATGCGGSACMGGAALFARLAPDGTASQLALSTDDHPNLILRNLGTTNAENVRVTSNSYSVVSGCGNTLAPGEECSLSLSGRAAGSITVQANNLPAFSTSLPATTRIAQPIGISPHELDFGIVTSASSAATRTITVHNFSASPQTFSSQKVGSSQSSFTLAQTSTTCTPLGDGVHVLIPGNATCAITLRLTPSASAGSDGPVQATWQIGNVDVAITGYTQAAAVSLSASTIDFGRRYVNGPASARYLFVSNASDSAQAHATVVSTNPAFHVADQCPISLQPHSVCRLELTYQAGTAPSSDALSLAVDGSTVTVLGETFPQPTLAGASTNPNLSLSATSVVFADPVIVTTTSDSSQSVTVSNTGAVPFALTLALTGDFTETTDCPAALAGHASCTVSLTFTPSAEGTRNGLLAISVGPAAPMYVSLSGTGLPLLPQNNGVDFGAIPVNTPAVLWMKVQHALVSATATSSDPNYRVIFVEDIGYGHGRPAAASFLPTATGPCLNCWLGIQFTPSSSGVDLASLTLASSGVGKAASLVVTGTGVPSAGLVLTPVMQDFGRIAVHSTGASTLFQLTNLTNGIIAATGVSVTGDFAASADPTGATDCPNTNLNEGESCLLPVQFTPAATGTRMGQVTIHTSAGSAAATLTGTGTENPGVEFSPGELRFDNTPDGSSKQQTITITNTSSAAVSIGAPTSSDAQFTLSSTCSNLAAGSSCTLTVTYTPGSTLTTGTLTIPVTSSPAGAPSTSSYAIALTALYTSETSGLQIVPGEHETVNFGVQAVGTVSPPRLLRVNNLTAQAMGIRIAAPRQFAVIANACSTVPANGSCDLSVQFTPLTTGDATGTILLQGTPADGSATRSGLAYLEGYGKGTGQLRVSGNIDITGVLRFGQVGSGQTAVQTLTLTNPSTSTSGSTATVRRVLSEAPFLTTTTCGDPLAPGQSCTVSVSYAPTYQVANSADLATPQMDTSTITIETDSADGPYFIDMAGQVAPVRSSAPSVGGVLQTINISQGSLTFGGTGVGSSSVAQTVTLTNTGSSAVHIHGVTTSAGFTATTECSTLQPNGTCDIRVAYQPQSAGKTVGALELRSDSVSSLEFVSLTGTAGDASVSLSAQALDFGGVLLGRSTAQSVTLANTGPVDVTFTGATIAGNDFSLLTSGAGTHPCPAPGGVLKAGATCTLGVSFTPISAGSRQGKLSVVTSATSLPLVVTLAGIGLQPALSVTPASLDFGTVTIGNAAALSLTLRNGSPIAVNRLRFSASGPLSVASTCGASSLAGGSSCAVTVTFSPTQAGAFSGALTIASDDPASPLIVPLSGPGASQVVPSTGSFSLTVNGASTASVTVQQGLAATYSLLATPGSGFSGTVALTCTPDSGATYATCSLVPASLTLSAGSEGSTATITTVTAVPLARVGWGSRALLAGMLPCCLGLLIAPGRRFAAVLMLTAAIGLSGCGSGGDPRIRYTSVGTYHFHVTATPTTGTAAPQDVSLTLVIVPR